MTKILKNKINFMKIGFYWLLIIAFSRPLITILENRTPIPIHIIIPTNLLYILFLIILVSIRKLKLDATNILIIVFGFYSLLSLVWGTNLKQLIAFILPFSCYFGSVIFCNNKKKSVTIIFALLIGYIVPIIGSAVMMFFGLSISHVVWGSGVTRQFGLYAGFHVCAHSMVIFSFVFALSVLYCKSKKVVYTLIFILTMSFYSLWNTFVRSGYAALLSFWMTYYIFKDKRILMLIIMILLAVGTWKSSTVNSIFWKADTYDRERNLTTASSGRTEIWTHNLNLFCKLPISRKVLGSGIGSESKNVVGGPNDIWSSHNDYISILMTLGVVGFLLYSSIIISILFDILKYEWEIQEKLVYLSIIIATLVTSVLTNGYVFRFEDSQTFWLLMGLKDSLMESKQLKT